MKPELELLEKYDLVKDEDCIAVEDFSNRRLSGLYEQLYSMILERQFEDYSQSADETDPFTFMASASIRADSTCYEYQCRAVKLDFLSRYSALYANKVMLPVLLSKPDKALKDTHTAKYHLARTVQSLLILRPLIQSGVIKPVIMRSWHCKHTMPWVKRMSDTVYDEAWRATRYAAGQFKVVYQLPEKSPTGESTIYVEGPKDLIEHGHMVMTWNESSTWRRKSWRFDRDGKVELRGPKKLARIYHLAFEKIAHDTGFYLAFARRQSARYLSDCEGETFLLDALTDDDEVASNNRSLHHLLAHLVPLMGDLPVETLMRIRREERDSFVRYRLALHLLLREVLAKKKRTGKREIQELFREKIEPELIRVKSELKLERNRQAKRIIGGAVGLAASVALGTFGGFLPLLAKGAAVAASAMVGGRLLSKAAEQVCEHGANLREKNDFYFLLRAAQVKGME